jgi:hypothetical protein
VGEELENIQGEAFSAALLNKQKQNLLECALLLSANLCLFWSMRELQSYLKRL